MKLTKRLFLALAASTTIATLPIAAFAQDWQPKRPIDFTIMAGAGGGARARRGLVLQGYHC